MVGILPVVGPRGVVGGVKIEPGGLVERSDPALEQKLRGRWVEMQSREPDLIRSTEFRLVSLARLDRAIGRRVAQQKPVTETMFLLAGLQRIHYVIAMPEQNDVLIAGPAGPWRINEAGDVVSVAGGDAVLRLDDLADALRCNGGSLKQISCSIEPTAEGLDRYRRIQSRLRTFSPQAVRAMKEAIGDQQVLFEGIREEGHFANVMLAADVMMKRFAMGLEKPSVDRMPPYTQLLAKTRGANIPTNPRWWMSVNYAPLECSEDRLHWRIQGQGVRVESEADDLGDGQRRFVPNQGANHVTRSPASVWAETMTERFEALTRKTPVFGSLRGCIDLAVAAALIEKEDLLYRCGCDLTILRDVNAQIGPKYPVARSIDSVVGKMKMGRSWMITVSGGVQLDTWSVVSDFSVQKTPVVDQERLRSFIIPDRQRDGEEAGNVAPTVDERWWW